MTYTAHVTREDGHWLADIDLPGAHTYARNLTTLQASVDEVIRLVADLDGDATVDVNYVFDGLDDDATAAARIGAERINLDRQRERLNAATQESVRVLLGRGYSVRDVAGLLHVTAGRVSQIGSELVR